MLRWLKLKVPREGCLVSSDAQKTPPKKLNMKEEDNFHQKSRSWFSKSSTTQGHNFTSLGGPKESEKILGLTSNHHGMGSKEAWSTACPMSQFDGDVPCETVRSPNQRDLVKRSRDMVTTCPHNVSKGIDKELE